MRIACLALLLTQAHVFGAIRIASYHADVRAVSNQDFAVDIQMELQGGPAPQAVISLETPSGGRISDLEFHSATGPASCEIEAMGILERLTCESLPTVSNIRYRVYSPSPRRWIPLPVPQLPTIDMAGSVRITIQPRQDTFLGDSFPSFQRDGASGLVAELSNVPSHIEVVISTTGHATFRDRYITPANVSNAAVIVLLLFGSGVRAVLRRRKEA